MTFCTPAPAAEQHRNLEQRCALTTIAFIAVLDDITSEEEAQAVVKNLPGDDQKWLFTTVFPAYKLAGEPPLELAVPHVYANCMKRGAV